MLLGPELYVWLKKATLLNDNPTLELPNTPCPMLVTWAKRLSGNKLDAAYQPTEIAALSAK
jgi:hypothetical protein